MTALSIMTASISKWMREHTLGIGGYVGASGFFAQFNIKTSLTELGAFVGTLADINVILAFLIAAVTLGTKGIELYKKVKAMKKEEEANEADRDSSGVDQLRDSA